MPSFKRLVPLLNLYPPFFFTGIRIKDYNKDFTRFDVRLRMRWYNKNLFGTHFGGSLYSMCDPFFVFILVANLGEEFIVWDKSASIKFKKPGKGEMKAIFEISPNQIEEIGLEMTTVDRKTFWFTANVVNKANEIVAEVEKEVYIRRKIQKK